MIIRIIYRSEHSIKNVHADVYKFEIRYNSDKTRRCIYVLDSHKYSDRVFKYLCPLAQLKLVQLHKEEAITIAI